MHIYIYIYIYIYAFDNNKFYTTVPNIKVLSSPPPTHTSTNCGHLMILIESSKLRKKL